MSHKFEIPERTSSKRTFAEIEADKDKIARLETDIERESKKIKAEGSFDSKYWTKLGQVSELKTRHSQLSLNILRDGATDERWKESKQAKRLQEEE